MQNIDIKGSGKGLDVPDSSAITVGDTLIWFCIFPSLIAMVLSWQHVLSQFTGKPSKMSEFLPDAFTADGGTVFAITSTISFLVLLVLFLKNSDRTRVVWLTLEYKDQRTFISDVVDVVSNRECGRFALHSAHGRHDVAHLMVTVPTSRPELVVPIVSGLRSKGLTVSKRFSDNTFAHRFLTDSKFAERYI